MNALGKAASVELKSSGVHVMTVCPGYVRTAFGANALKGAGRRNIRPSGQRGITTERVARATLDGYIKRKREVIVPWYMHLPVKIYQLFPGVVEAAMMKMTARK